MGGVADRTVPTYDDIRAAVALVAPWVRRTPVLEVEVAGRPITLKLELLQHSGSFKVRGAFNNVLSAPERPATLVAASGGNHGLAVAHVGHRLGIATRIFVPETAPAVKVDAIAALGAEVNAGGATYAEAHEASRDAADRPDVLALHAYDSFGTVAGQATLGVEIGQQLPDVDTVLLAVGGGGLFAGVTRGLAGPARRPGWWRWSRRVPHDAPRRRRGSAGGRPGGRGGCRRAGRLAVGEIAMATALEHGTTSLLVEDDAIADARRWLWREARVAAEPAGATALAALSTGGYVPGDDERVCVVICGGNADPSGL